MQIKVRHKKLRDGKRETVYLDFYDRGKRWLEYLGLYLNAGSTPTERDKNRETLRLAEDIAAKRRLEYRSEADGFTSRVKQKADFVAYCRKLKDSRRSPHTRAVWESAIQHLEAFAGSGIPFNRVNHAFLLGFKAFLLERVSVNSAWTYLARIKTACGQAVKEAIFSRDPALGVAIPMKATRREYLSIDELQLLADTECPNQATKAAFLFSAFSGLRYSDVRALTWDKVKESNGGLNLEFTQIKTGEVESLPLAQQAVDILKAQENSAKSAKTKIAIPSSAVFKLPSKAALDKAIKRWVKRAGIQKHISFHCARHTFATLGLTSGVDLYTVSKLLGHRNISTTQIYAQIVDQKKRDAVNLFPKLSISKGDEK